MAYFHNKTTSFFLRPTRAISDLTAGASYSTYSAGNIWGIEFSFTGIDAARMHVPIAIPQAAGTFGLYLKSIDTYYQTYVNLDCYASTSLQQSAWPANGAAHAASVLQTLELSSDTAGYHVDRLTLTAPLWLESTENYIIRVAITSGAAWDILFYGFRLNCELRL